MFWNRRHFPGHRRGRKSEKKKKKKKKELGVHGKTDSSGGNLPRKAASRHKRLATKRNLTHGTGGP